MRTISIHQPPKGDPIEIRQIKMQMQTTSRHQSPQADPPKTKAQTIPKQDSPVDPEILPGAEETEEKANTPEGFVADIFLDYTISEEERETTSMEIKSFAKRETHKTIPTRRGRKSIFNPSTRQNERAPDP
jgi:hypothetical protein